MVGDACHLGSARRERPFVRVNCSALSESLLEGELFGHVRGAFTGAVQDKIGRFEAVDGGTILVDEIGDISPVIQLKLLRVLQERQLERVGESAPRKVDVRVICATHRDLRELVREGRFREDLFYRIRVFPMELPPLRRHKSDIPYQKADLQEPQLSPFEEIQIIARTGNNLERANSKGIWWRKQEITKTRAASSANNNLK